MNPRPATGPEFLTSTTVAVVELGATALRVAHHTSADTSRPASVITQFEPAAALGADGLVFSEAAYQVLADDPAAGDPCVAELLGGRHVLFGKQILSVDDLLTKALRHILASVPQPVGALVLPLPSTAPSAGAAQLVRAAKAAGVGRATVVDSDLSIAAHFASGAGLRAAGQTSVNQYAGAPNLPAGLRHLIVVDAGARATRCALLERATDGHDRATGNFGPLYRVCRAAVAPGSGGIDVDEALLALLAGSRPALLDALTDPAVALTSRAAVRNAKEALARHEVVDVRLPPAAGGRWPGLNRRLLEEAALPAVSAVCVLLASAIPASLLQNPAVPILIAGGGAPLALLSRKVKAGCAGPVSVIAERPDRAALTGALQACAWGAGLSGGPKAAQVAGGVPAPAGPQSPSPSRRQRGRREALRPAEEPAGPTVSVREDPGPSGGEFVESGARSQDGDSPRGAVRRFLLAMKQRDPPGVRVSALFAGADGQRSAVADQAPVRSIEDLPALYAPVLNQLAEMKPRHHPRDHRVIELAVNALMEPAISGKVLLNPMLTHRLDGEHRRAADLCDIGRHFDVRAHAGCHPCCGYRRGSEWVIAGASLFAWGINGVPVVNPEAVIFTTSAIFHWSHNPPDHHHQHSLFYRKFPPRARVSWSELDEVKGHFELGAVMDRLVRTIREDSLRWPSWWP